MAECGGVVEGGHCVEVESEQGGGEDGENVPAISAYSLGVSGWRRKSEMSK